MLKLRAHVTYANVASTLALVVSLSGGVAYASHLVVRSSDIVDGAVQRVDIDGGAVTTTKVADGSLTGNDVAAGALSGRHLANGTVGSLDVKDNSLTGVDVAEHTLVGLDADTLGGHYPEHMIGVGDVSRREAVDMPDCSPALNYLSITLNPPRSGFVLVNASFTARNGNFGPSAIAARIDRSSPAPLVGEWMEETVDSPNSRYSFSLAEVFQVDAGQNTLSLLVCDSSDTAGQNASAIAAQMTVLYTPFPLPPV